jgi:hypothetical protein
MRLIKKPQLKKIEKKFTVGTSHFGPEFTLLVVLNKIKFIEIPVHYGERVGESMGTKNKVNAFKLGIRMIWLVLTYRLISWFNPKKFVSKK